MPTANFKSEWLYSSRFLRLTPIQRYSFMAALMWAVGEESDGYIGHDDVDLIPGFDRSAIPKLLEQRLLTETVGGWFVSPNGESFEASQTTKAQLEQCRKNNRERKARSRAKAQVDEVVTDDVSGGVPHGVTRDTPVTPQAKQSKANTSKAISKGDLQEQQDPVVTKSGMSLEKTKRAARVASDYMPPPLVVEAIVSETGATRDDLRREHAKFMDYWRAKSGQGATKVDWDATWRNWMRTAAENGRFGGVSQPDKASRYLQMDNPYIDGGQSALDW